MKITEWVYMEEHKLTTYKLNWYDPLFMAAFGWEIFKGMYPIYWRQNLVKGKDLTIFPNQTIPTRKIQKY